MSESYLVTPTTWGAFNPEAVEEHSVFLCGVCSKDGKNVYHNLAGEHWHLDIAKLLKGRILLEEPCKDVLYGGAV